MATLLFRMGLLTPLALYFNEFWRLIKNGEQSFTLIYEGPKASVDEAIKEKMSTIRNFNPRIQVRCGAEGSLAVVADRESGVTVDLLETRSQ